MSRGIALLWVFVAGGSAAAMGLSARAALAARERAGAELRELRQAREHVAEIEALRAAAPVWASKEPPASGLAPRVSAALAAAGLPASALAGLSPEAELDVGGGGGGEWRARRRRATLTLTGTTLPQVGKFLAAWREHEPDWTVTGVDLAPEPGKAPPQGGDLPLRATVTLEALYVDDVNGGIR